MYCMNCGQSLAADARSCEKCGAVQGDEPSGPPPSAPDAGPGGWSAMPPDAQRTAFAIPQLSGLEFDAKRLGRGDMIAGGASLLLLISLFLPWFHVQAEIAPGFTVPIPGLTRSGLGAHGWLFIVLLSSLAVIAYILARAFAVQLPITAAHWQVLAAGTGVGLLLTLIGLVDKPSGFGWSVGAFIGILAAIAAMAGAALVRNDAKRVSVSAMPPPPMPPPPAPPMPPASAPAPNEFVRRTRVPRLRAGQPRRDALLQGLRAEFDRRLASPVRKLARSRFHPARYRRSR